MTLNLQEFVPFSWMGTERLEYGTKFSDATCACCFIDGGHAHVPATWEAIDSLGQTIPVCNNHAEQIQKAIGGKLK